MENADDCDAKFFCDVPECMSANGLLPYLQCMLKLIVNGEENGF